MNDSFRPSIIIPTYNHCHAIEHTVAEALGHRLPLVVVDDGSTDGSAVSLRRLKERVPEMQLVTRAVNGGKGAAVRDGIFYALQAGFTHALLLDADGQHAALDVPRFLVAAKEHPNALILGRPLFDQSAPLARRWGREVSNLLLWLETGRIDARDALCGYRVYPIHCCAEIMLHKVVSARMEFDPEVLTRLLWAGFEVINVPTSVAYPADGISHFHYWQDNIRIARLHLTLLRHALLRLFSR